MSSSTMCLLQNPLRWLRGVRIGHSEHLYLHHYDLAELAANPFANLLIATRNDISRRSCPIGDTIQVVVAKDGNRRWLKPVLEKPRHGQNPAKFVLNSRLYIKFHLRKRFFPVPLKFLAHSPAVVPQIKVLPEFENEVEKLYVDRIRELLAAAVVDHTSDNVLHLRPGLKNSVLWSKDKCVVTTNLVATPMTISYRANPELARILISLANFDTF